MIELFVFFPQVFSFGTFIVLVDVLLDLIFSFGGELISNILIIE